MQSNSKNPTEAHGDLKRSTSVRVVGGLTSLAGLSTRDHLVAMALIGILTAGITACSGTSKDASPAQAETPSAAPVSASQVAAPAPAAPASPPGLQKPLKIEPVKGFVGDSFTIVAPDLPQGQTMEFQWVTWDGGYDTQAVANSVQFQERTFKQNRISLGRAQSDAQGWVSATFTVPEDFGEVHDIYGVVDGMDVARGGFRIFRNSAISPAEGPLGTPITITVNGLGWKPFESTASVRYDNGYTGFVSAVTTKGSATFQIRAAGAVGPHIIQLTAASPGVPFLNNQQSGTAHIPYMDLQLTFNVTEDKGLPPDIIQWPEADRVSRDGVAVPKTRLLSGISASLEPASGPTLTRSILRASGLPAESEVEIFWVPGQASDSQGIRSLGQISLGKAVSSGDGSLSAPVTIPDDWGGWQLVKLAQGSKMLAEVPFYVEQSLVGVTPKKVKAGETFSVEIKGGGWTELDKGVAVTYDNSYIGYACAATSSGDITMNLVATGAPGTHLIDLYPMIYRHKGTHTPEDWNFELPQLTALWDHPGLALGYRLPAFRLAIEVTP